MAKDDNKKSDRDLDPAEIKAKADAEAQAIAEAAKAAEEAKAKAPDLTGLVKMHKDGSIIHANPLVIKEHEKNGWKLA